MTRPFPTGFWLRPGIVEYAFKADTFSHGYNMETIGSSATMTRSPSSRTSMQTRWATMPLGDNAVEYMLFYENVARGYGG